MFNKFKEKLQSIHLVSNYKKMYPYVKPYWKRALGALLITLPIGSMDAAIAWVLKPYMDIVMIEKNAQAGTLLPCLVVIFALVQSLLNYAATYLNSWVGQRITMDMKAKLFHKMQRNEASFFDRTTSGDVQFRFNTDAEMACSGLLSNMKLFTTRLFSSLSLVFVLFWNSWQLAIVATIVLFGALLPLANVRKKINGVMKKTVFSGARILTHYNEAFAGNRVISSYNLYATEDEKFQATLKDVFKLGMAMIRKTGLLAPMMHFITAVGIALTIYFGGYLIGHGHLTPGGFVSFITALLMLYQPIKSMGSNFTSVQMSFMAMERVFEMLDRVPVIRNKKDAKKLESVKKVISYNHVNFEYLEGRPILKDITLDIPVGKTYAFVGNSGGGKTTLVNLLPRFYDVKNGSVSIDGTDVRDLELDSLHDKIAIVFQDNFLFAGTLRENILLERKNVTPELLDKAIKGACLDEFVNSLEQGLETQVGERGILLSGGQKQRVAIARAFIKNAPIVILDEATSALDNKAEQIVQQAIYNLMENRTVLVIAHRLSTVKNADQIVVVDHGEIKEQGTHEELMNNPNSVYASLYRSQLQ